MERMIPTVNALMHKDKSPRTASDYPEMTSGQEQSLFITSSRSDSDTAHSRPEKARVKGMPLEGVRSRP